ncbi:MAG TPA: cardiolipin synthase [Gemmata sp.]|nr:cardiolipin synthase [Gemmata sp.]
MPHLFAVTPTSTDLAASLVVLNFVLVVGTLAWVLHAKRETMSAIAWSLLVLLVPFLGAFLFFILGSQTLTRPINRRRRRSSAYKKLPRGEGWPPADVPDRWDTLALLGHHGDGFPVTGGNAVMLYHEGRPAFDAMIAAIESARHHVHIQFFIFRNDAAGRRFIDALAACAARGVQVRFLYDSVGAYNLSSRMLRQLTDAKGQATAFLPILNPLRRLRVSLRVNLRNHRKLLVVDGRVGFCGGLNIGDEYLGLHPKFGRWRDTHMRVEGPAVEGLQRVFLEDWFFATEEPVHGSSYFPKFARPPGASMVQVVHSGPDMEYKAIRETYFAGILNARKRVWIASPYFVPDAGLRDAMTLMARAGIDVRYLGLFRPDKWIPLLAARFYWADMLAAGVKVYQYAAGMMHAKYVLVDGEWASVGSANMDNRSLLLNFEANCQLFDESLVAELEREYLNDLELSVRLDPKVFAARPFFGRLAENACRLFSPIL